MQRSIARSKFTKNLLKCNPHGLCISSNKYSSSSILSQSTTQPQSFGNFRIYRHFSAETEQPQKEVNLFPDVCFYKTLNLSTNATFPQIKSAYLKLAKKLHPDVSKDPKAKEKFPLLSEAYKVLSHPKNRKQYDEVIGISDPTWSEDAKFNPDFQNNEEFMNYVRGDRNYDDERKMTDLSFEEKNAEDLYDYFRAKHLGGYGLRQTTEEESKTFGGRQFGGFSSPLQGMNGLDMQGEGLVEPGSKMAFNMKIDKELREDKKKRVEDNDYILFAQNRHDAYYAKKQEHLENKNVPLNLFKEFKWFGVCLIVGVAFIFTQIQPSGKGKLTGRDDRVIQTQKHVDKGLGVKDKITPI